MSIRSGKTMKKILRLFLTSPVAMATAQTLTKMRE